MSGKDLTAAEKAFLVLLMAENREVSNAELSERYGISLTGKVREALNSQKLVVSRKVGRGLAHELTDQGWARCKEELTATYVKGTGPAFPALHALLGALHRYLAGTQHSLPDLFVPSGQPSNASAKQKAKPKDPDTRVIEAYHQTATEPNAWVKLADLRSALGRSVKRAEVDAALKRLAVARQIILIPEENQKTLRARDREAALVFGDESNHLMCIETA